MTLRPDLTPPVTRDSIMTAFLATKADRDAITRETGLAFTKQGAVVAPKETR